MEVGGLYQFVLMLVLVGIVLGVGLTVLGKFSTASGVSGDASTAINNTVTAIADLPGSWLSVIVVVVVAAIVLTIVLRSFSGGGAR